MLLLSIIQPDFSRLNERPHFEGIETSRGDPVERGTTRLNERPHFEGIETIAATAFW